jgi:hypothetical protein
VHTIITVVVETVHVIAGCNIEHQCGSNPIAVEAERYRASGVSVVRAAPVLSAGDSIEYPRLGIATASGNPGAVWAERHR